MATIQKRIYPILATFQTWKKKKTKILLYSWLRTGIYSKNLVIWILLFFKIWWIWTICFLKNSFDKSENFIGKFLPKFDLKTVISTTTFLQNFANKNTLIGTHLSKTQNHSYLIYITFKPYFCLMVHENQSTHQYLEINGYQYFKD